MESSINQKFISLQEGAKLCGHSQEYLSLRARQGKLKAIKLGRNWVTTEAWLDEYVRQAAEHVQKNQGRYLSLQKAGALSGHSQEYLSLRARQGKLKAIKLGRNWVTTEAWLDEYVKKTKLAEVQAASGIEAEAMVEVVEKGRSASGLSPQKIKNKKAFYRNYGELLQDEKRQKTWSLILISVFGKINSWIASYFGEIGNYFDSKAFGIRSKIVYYYFWLKSFANYFCQQFCLVKIAPQQSAFVQGNGN